MIAKNFLIVAVFGSLFLIGFIFQNYLMSIAVSLILAIATRPLYCLLSRKMHFVNKRVYISTFLTLLLFLFVFLPLIYFATVSYEFVSKLSTEETLEHSRNILIYLQTLPAPFDFFQNTLNAILSEFNVSSIDLVFVKSFLNKAALFFWKINAIVYEFFLILFFYFLFNLYGFTLFMFISRFLPMIKRFKRRLHEELSSTIASVFFGTLFSMSAQGVVFGLFLHFFTDYDAFYLAMATGFLTAIPVVGTYLVAIVLAMIELVNQNYSFAIVIMLFALIVLSGLIDNVLRLIFMRYFSKKFSLRYSLSELSILLAMIAGIGVFGAWGIIIAPAILSLCIAILDISKKSGIMKSF